MLDECLDYFKVSGLDGLSEKILTVKRGIWISTVFKQKLAKLRVTIKSSVTEWHPSSRPTNLFF